MLTIRVEFVGGTFRGDPDGSAHTGGLDRGEWPPSPSRLFAAFVAADGTGDRCRMTDGSELTWLESLPAPQIQASSRVHHQALRPRFVARPDRAKNTMQDYPARVAAEVRPGVRVAPRSPAVRYIWNRTPPPEVFRPLRVRAARIGYLGTSDSPVRVRVDTDTTAVAEADLYVPDPEGAVAISVPRSGDLKSLDRMYEDWIERGPSVSRAHYPGIGDRMRYRPPGSTPDVDRGSVVAWLRLEKAVSGRRVTAVTDLLKKAVLAKHQVLHGEPPAVLHGHGFAGRGFDLARYLALPDVGYPHSRGRIHGLAVWLPPGCDRDVRATTRDAAQAIRQLTGNALDARVRPWAGEPRPIAATPHRWTRTSRCWVTAFPVEHERRVPVNLAEVSRWCAHAGLPAPTAFRTARCPLVRGAVDLAPTELNRTGRTGRPYSHLQVWFSEPVGGPVVIGAGRQRGLGLCVPVDESSGPR